MDGGLVRTRRKENVGRGEDIKKLGPMSGESGVVRHIITGSLNRTLGVTKGNEQDGKNWQKTSIETWRGTGRKPKHVKGVRDGKTEVRVKGDPLSKANGRGVHQLERGGTEY